MMKASSQAGVYLLWLGLAFACPAVRAQDVVVVANEELQVSQITSAELREIFTGVRTRFHNGTRAVPVVLKGGPIHEVFLKNYMGESPDEFRTGWRKATFTGQGVMPKEFTSEAAMMEYVAATPGAVGYVSRITPNNHVTALTVIKESR
jgi:ABC-type phosphate transport system substrate-binding protein